MTDFEEIEIKNFRNISSQRLSFDREDIVLIGTNGQGKTNFLEAVYILCYGSSFRTPFLKECVSHGESGFVLEGTFRNEFGELQKIRSVFEEGKRYIEIDGKEVKDRKELIYQFPCIVFCHEDISFIKGEPETRRRFFDQMMSLSSPVFLDNIRLYRNILAKRNASIKTENYALLPIYDEKIARVGVEIMRERKKCIDDFNSLFPSLYSKVSGGKDDLFITYQSSWDEDDEEFIVDYLRDTKERDIKMQTTTSGIHRDRFVIKDSHGNFSQTGSTGQIRLCSLLFRVAEARSFQKVTGKKPILLLDDVLLELDDRKRSLFLDELSDYSQAFYTFLPRENYFSADGRKPVFYKVEDGCFEKDERHSDLS